MEAGTEIQERQDIVIIGIINFSLSTLLYGQRFSNLARVGGGIIGCTIAYYLTHHPKFDPSVHSVTVIEASKLATGASGKAGGLIAAWAYPNNLAKLSFDLHNELAQQHNGAETWGYRRVMCGQLTASVQGGNVARSRSPKQAGIALGKYWPRDPRNSSLLPKDLDWFDDGTAKSYEEFADTSSTAQIYPYQFTTTLASLAEAKGARFVSGTVKHINCRDANDTTATVSPLAASDELSKRRAVSVTYFDKASSQQVTVNTTTVVLATGPWTSDLLPTSRIRPLRAHSVTFKLQRPVSAYCLFTDIQLAAGSTPISLEIYARPNNEVYICSKGDLNAPLQPPQQVAEISAETCQEMIDAATSVSGELRNGQVTGRRACYLPVLEASQKLDTGLNNDPMIGNSELAGLVIATGHSCWGISNAPGTGKAVSELIFDGQISCIDATGLDPKRVN